VVSLSFGRHLRASKSVVRRGHLHKRDRFLVVRASQITDLDVEGSLSAGHEIMAKHND
jgi:hypothetical protein